MNFKFMLMIIDLLSSSSKRQSISDSSAFSKSEFTPPTIPKTSTRANGLQFKFRFGAKNKFSFLSALVCSSYHVRRFIDFAREKCFNCVSSWNLIFRRPTPTFDWVVKRGEAYNEILYRISVSFTLRLGIFGRHDVLHNAEPYFFWHRLAIMDHYGEMSDTANR